MTGDEKTPKQALDDLNEASKINAEVINKRKKRIPLFFNNKLLAFNIQ